MKKQNVDILNQFSEAVIEYTLILAMDDLNKKNGHYCDLSLPIGMGKRDVEKAKTNLVNLIESLGG